MLEKEEYRITIGEDQIINLKEAELDMVEQSDGSFHILHKGQSFHAKILSFDTASKKYLVEVNGEKFPISLADQKDLLVEKMGLGTRANQTVKDIKAPMPGLVLEVEVEIGQKVEKGEGLLILEAMKMENIIKSAGEGVIKEIHIGKGAAVDKGQLLIEME